jgi:hypothetical protein
MLPTTICGLMSWRIWLKIATVNNSIIRTTKFTRSFALVISCLFLIAAAGDQKGGISFSKLIEFKQELQQYAQTVVGNQFTQVGYSSKQKSNIKLQISFDEEKLKSDMALYRQSAGSSVQKLISDLKSSGQNSSTAKSAKNGENKPLSKQSELRFGMLDIGLDDEATSDLLVRDYIPEDQRQLNIAINIPSTDPSSLKFIYDPADYVKSMKFDVQLPEGAPEELDAIVRAAIYENLELNRLVDAKADAIISVTRLAVPLESGFSVWLKDFVDPKSGIIGMVLGSLFLGILILVGIVLLAKGFGNIATTIGTLKPPEEASNDVVETVEEEATVNEDEDQGDGYEKSAVAQALTSEMQTIREQLSDVIEDNSDLGAELLRDMFYEPNGLREFRDLLSFAGYKTLKPAMDKLPKTNLEQISNYMEETRNESASLLNGVEVGQKLYRSCITKITGKVDLDGALSELKSVLVSTEDDTLNTMVQTAGPTELAMILNMLTVERGNKVMKQIPLENLKEACSLLDSSPDDLDSLVKDVISSLDKADFGGAEKRTDRQKRFILRLVQSAGIDEESDVLAIAGDEDPEILEAMITAKLFFLDLKYVPLENCRKTLDTFSATQRGEFLFVCEDELKNSLLETYEEGSKIREMVEAELTQIGSNEKRQKALEKKKATLIESYMNKIRKLLENEPELIKLILAAKCEAKGIDLNAKLEPENEAPVTAA